VCFLDAKKVQQRSRVFVVGKWSGRDRGSTETTYVVANDPVLLGEDFELVIPYGLSVRF
jgi:hypothetical protein